ncbi:MAG: hypothetical protein Q9187_008200 [Circinaria calcarea]
MALQVQELGGQDAIWVQNRLREVEALDLRASRENRDLSTIHHQQLEEYNSLQGATTDLIIEEMKSMSEAVKGIEGLGAKLEYELSALTSKVEDVEDGVAELERQVVEIEARAKELEEDKADDDPWFSWLFSIFAGQESLAALQVTRSQHR